MNRTALITLIVTGITCGIVLVTQAYQNHSLRSHVGTEQEAILGLESSLEKVTRDSVNSPPRALSPIAASQEPESTGLETHRSKDQVERVRKDLLALTETLGKANQSPGAFLGALPEFLELIEDLTIDELIEVADSIDLSSTFGSDPLGDLGMIMYLIVAEHDPELALSNTHATINSTLRGAFVDALAKRDLAAARQWIQKPGLFSPEERGYLEKQLAIKALHSDVSGGFDMVRTIIATSDTEGSDIFPPTLIPDGQMDKVINALQQPENSDVRPHLINTVLNSAGFEGGVDGMRQSARELNLSPDELREYFQRSIEVGDRFVFSEPEKFLSWMMEEQDFKGQIVTVPSAIASWSRLDFNAAGTYLGEMEPSVIKDRSVNKFARMVSAIDPEAASIWSLEIEDAQVRNATVKEITDKWLEKDHDAAARWLKENGYNER